MKKLSLILVLIMTLSLMVGALTTIAFAAGDGTQANPITVGGEGADYATVGEALAAIGAAEGTTYIKVTGNTTETAAGIVLANDVVIYSDATGDDRPVITLAADANIGAASGYFFWITVDGAELTFDGLKIDTSAFFGAKDTQKASGTIILNNGAKVSVVDSVATHGGSKTKNGGFVYLGAAGHSGDIVIDNSTVTSGNRGIYIEKSTGSSSITLINNAVLKSTTTHGIQCSATTPAALTVTVIDSEISANGVGMYNRAKKADVTLINAKITSTSQVVDARNDTATLDLVVVGGTFKGVDLVKFKSPTAVINIIGADVAGVTTLINNELSSENVTVKTYGITSGNFTNVADEKITKIDEAGAHALVGTLFADDAVLKDAAIKAIPHICVFDQEVVDNKFLATEATCTAQATYYKSCVCGEKGTETFAAGEVLPHVFDQEIAGDEYLVSDATCTTGAVFYKSCECGLKGEETFMSLGSLGHLFGEWTTVTEPTVDAEGVKERECSVCGEKETKSIEKLPVTEAPVVEEPTFTEKVLGKVNSVKDWTVAKAVALKNKAAGALGCGGSIGGTSIIIMLAAAGAVIARKKED